MADFQVWKLDRFPLSLWSSRRSGPSAVAQEKRQFLGYGSRPAHAKDLDGDASRRRSSQLKAYVSRAHIALYRGVVCVSSGIREEDIQNLLAAWDDALSDLDQAQILAEQNPQVCELVSHLRRHVRELIDLVSRQPTTALEGMSAQSRALFIMDSVDCLEILIEKIDEHSVIRVGDH